MDTFTSFGRIFELEYSEKGYRRLTVSVNIPFKTKLMRFNVWDDNLLKTELGENFKVGDEVRVVYNYKNTFLNLIEMSPSSVDMCPICFTTIEATNAQIVDCLRCTSIPESDHKIRLNVQMMLMASTLKQYLYSNGYRLELHLEEQNKTYTSVIFENNLLYNSIKDLKVGNKYFVVGWKSPNSGFIDLVDIY